MPKNTSTQPKHVAIICDGNRRWAREHALEVFKGHEKAVKETFEPLIDHAVECGIEYLTFWIFSTENWDRDKKEIDFLMNLFRNFFSKQADDLHKKGVRVKMIGNLSHFAPDIQEMVKETIEKTKDNTKITVQMAMSYGGRDEIVRAVKKIVIDAKDGKLDVAAIDKDLIGSYLDTAGVPDPDMIVRTSGELRMSGFMSWQSEYSEYFFPKWHFPEFSPAKLDELLSEYAQRQRRFGK